MAAKRYEEAIKLYTEAISIWPNNAIYYANRAAAYSCVRKFEEAAQDCELSIQRDPSYGKAYSRLGFISTFLHFLRNGLELCSAIAWPIFNSRTLKNLWRLTKRLLN